MARSSGTFGVFHVSSRALSASARNGEKVFYIVYGTTAQKSVDDILLKGNSLNRDLRLMVSSSFSFFFFLSIRFVRAAPSKVYVWELGVSFIWHLLSYILTISNIDNKEIVQRHRNSSPSINIGKQQMAGRMKRKFIRHLPDFGLGRVL